MQSATKIRRCFCGNMLKIFQFSGEANVAFVALGAEAVALTLFSSVIVDSVVTDNTSSATIGSAAT